MADIYFLHDDDGKCIGTIYDNYDPINLPSGTNFVKLTYEQINQMNHKYEHYRYLNNEFVKQERIMFCVSPSNLYVIGQHNKISVSIKAHVDSTEEEIQSASTKNYIVKVNGQNYDMEFGEIMMIEPESAGVYLIELLNENVLCDTARYAITVIESQEV